MKRRRLIGIACAVAFIAMIVVAFFWHTQRVRAEAIAEAELQYSHASKIKSDFAELTNSVNSLVVRESTELGLASEAGKERRESIIGGAAIQWIFDDADAELQFISEATESQQKREIGNAQLVDLIEKEYGEGASNRLRSSLADRNEALEDSYASWTQAIRSIRDSTKLRLEGRPSNFDSNDEYEKLYGESSRDLAKARALNSTTASELKDINDRIDANYDRTAKNLKSLGRIPGQERSAKRNELDEYVDNNIWTISALDMGSQAGTIEWKRNGSPSFKCYYPYREKFGFLKGQLGPNELSQNRGYHLFRSLDEDTNQCRVWAIVKA